MEYKFDKESVELIRKIEAGVNVDFDGVITAKAELVRILGEYAYVAKVGNVLVCFEYDGWTLFKIALVM
jgi:hypothetical protein